MHTHGDQEPSNDQIAWALHRLAAAWAAEDVQLAQALGVPSGDYLALKHVAVTDGIGPAELSRRLGMSTGSVNALINRLSAAGHLQRRRHRSDARRLTLHLTEPTRDAIAGHYHARAQRAIGAAASVSADQRTAILRFLDHSAWSTNAPHELPRQARVEGTKGSIARTV